MLLVFPDDPTDLNVTSKYFYIPVEDDDINEDLSQLFLVVMGVKKAVNPNLITIDPSSTFCDIVDNDRELLYLRIMQDFFAGVFM